MRVHTRKTKGHDLGRAATVVAQFHQRENAMHEDVVAWGAPGECHALLAQDECRRFRTVRRRVKAITGLPWRVYVKEVKRRTSPRFVYFHPVAAEPPSHGEPQRRRY